MEKRVLGIMLTILGVIGLILGAYYFVNHDSTSHNIKMICVFAILGIVFFAAGIGLIRDTRDIIRRDERIS